MIEPSHRSTQLSSILPCCARPPQECFLRSPGRVFEVLGDGKRYSRQGFVCRRLDSLENFVAGAELAGYDVAKDRELHNNTVTVVHFDLLSAGDCPCFGDCLKAEIWMFNLANFDVFHSGASGIFHRAFPEP